MTIVRLMIALTVLAGPAAIARPLPDRFDLGRDAFGDPCVAAIAWQRSPRGVGLASDQPWSITCRGVSAARVQGVVQPVAAMTAPAAAEAGARQCGDSRAVTMRGVAGASARRCFDPKLAMTVVEISFAHGGRTYIGASAANVVGPLEVALRAVAGVELPATTTDIAAPSIAVDSLAAAPAASSTSNSEGGFDAGQALQQGVAFIHRGLHVDASRILNDALSRLPAGSAAETRIELDLAAGLADSNIGQFQAADAHFAAAAALFGSVDAGRAAFLIRKRVTYAALDLVNRRRWRDAVTMLDSVAAVQQPLLDPITLGQLNQGDAGAASAVAVSDTTQLGWLVIEAQQNWVRSVALLGLGRVADSRAAVTRAAADVGRLSVTVSPASIAWLKSNIERQQGRVAAREGNYAVALASFDCAVATLQGVPPSAGCSVAAARSRGGAGLAIGGPVVAETQLERAGILARVPGTSQAAVLAEYRTAVDTLAGGQAASGSVPAALGSYLDLLVAAAAKGPAPAIEEDFFRALQTIGEPAIARDVARLQDVVTSEGSIGAKVRDRADVERTITGLRYQIAALGTSDPAAVAMLETRRTAAEAQLATLNAALEGDSRFRALDTQPATIADLRAALLPGEAYLKVAALRQKLYGVTITAERTRIYPLAVDAESLQVLTDAVLGSARSRTDASGQTVIGRYAVGTAFALFRAIAGPAEAELAGANAIVIDPAGPLRNVPLAILVTSADSVKRYRSLPKEQAGDYSQVAFLGTKANLATALSPRSFLIVRSKVAPSAAPQPFLGLGQNAPAVVGVPFADRPVLFGSGCSISYARWAAVTNGNPPVSGREIELAAQALGVPGAPEITGAAFSDTLLAADSDAGTLARYQVLHFATHGLPEQRFSEAGCATSIPAALVTTMTAPTDAGGASVSDGLLSFGEVGRLRLDANLVVLSACETSAGTSETAGRLAGQEDSAPTLDGLVRAFIGANARAVLATFWKVPASSESDDLIAGFYRAGRASSISTALREAQLSLIRRPRSSHPYYWGAYFVVGDGSKTMLTAPRATAASSASAPRLR